MSDIKKERDKDILKFHYLCKDLFKYIRRRIIKKYVFPELSLSENEPNKNWKYYKGEDEIITEEEKLHNLFKDNSFLKHVQKFYESLVIIINILEENVKNFEMSKKEIEIGERKINLLFEVNYQLNKFFNPGADIHLNQRNKFNGKNSQNITNHLSLVKLLNILNELKIINTIKDSNIMEDNNNNNFSEISKVYDNDINKENNYIDNNSKLQIKKENFKKEEKIINNDIENKIPFEDQNIINTSYNTNTKSKPSDNSSIKEFNFLSKKTKRDKDIYINRKSEKYIDIYDSNLIDLIGTKYNYNRSNNHNKQIIKDEDKYYKKESNSHDENIEFSENQNIGKENNENIKLNRSISFDEENSNSNSNNSNSINSNEFMINSKELEFKKELKIQFSCIFSYGRSNSDIIHEIKNILNKIHDIKFPENKNKFEKPYIIGSYKHFDAKFLLDSFPDIDIILKYNDIESVEEINEISKEIIYKKTIIYYF